YLAEPGRPQDPFPLRHGNRIGTSAHVESDLGARAGLHRWSFLPPGGAGPRGGWACCPARAGNAGACRAAVLSLPRGNAAASRDRWPERPKPLAATRLAGYSPGYVVTYLRGDPRRPRTLALDQVIGDGLLDPGRLGGQAQMLAEHRRRQDRRGRIRLLLARYVGRAAVHRLEHAGRGALRIDIPTGRQPDAAGHGSTEIGQDVAEEVVGHHHAEPLRLGDEVHAGRVDVAVVHGDLAE